MVILAAASLPVGMHMQKKTRYFRIDTLHPEAAAVLHKLSKAEMEDFCLL